MAQLSKFTIMQAWDAVFLATTGLGDLSVSAQLYAPNAGRTYTKSSMPAITSKPMGFTRDCPLQWDGTYQIRINVPTASGEVLANKLAAAVCAAFPRGYSLAVGTNDTLTVMQAIAMPGVIEGDFVSVPVHLIWTATE